MPRPPVDRIALAILLLLAVAVGLSVGAAVVAL